MTAFPFRAGPPLEPEAFAWVRQRLCLESCKWDPQIRDFGTLANFPVILDELACELLRSTAEKLTKEILAAEKEVVQRKELLARLSLPSRLTAVLMRNSRAEPDAPRVMRFDFHWTTQGWLISEVNSDVPGGFAEASDFPKLVSSITADLTPIGDPVPAWTQAVLAKRQGEGAVALLAAPSFTADQQVVAYLGKALAANGIASYFCEPSQLQWRDGFASLSTAYFRGPLSAIVRFYQAEWLAALPKRSGWEPLLGAVQTPVVNPGIAIVSESKRFPLVFDCLSAKTETLKAFFSETRDLSEVPWQTDDRWLVKAALSNCGDAVLIRPLLPKERWNAERSRILRRPAEWVAQKRFESIPLPTSIGPLYLCLGVYTVDGRMEGIYARGALRPLIDYEAIDIPILKEKSVSSHHG